MIRLRPTRRLALTFGLPAAVIGQGQERALTVLFSPAMQAALDTTYGGSERAVLEQTIRERVDAALGGGGCDGIAQVEITLLNARPTHPTDRQIDDDASLDRLGTHYAGGATFSARILDSAGRELRSLRYDWCARDERHSSLAAEAWGDVRLASEGLGSQLVRACRALGSSHPATP